MGSEAEAGLFWSFCCFIFQSKTLWARYCFIHARYTGRITYIRHARVQQEEKKGVRPFFLLVFLFLFNQLSFTPKLTISTMLRTITATNAVRTFKPVQAATAARRAYSATGFDNKEKAEEAKYIRAKVQSRSDSESYSHGQKMKTSHRGSSDLAFFLAVCSKLMLVLCLSSVERKLDAINLDRHSSYIIFTSYRKRTNPFLSIRPFFTINRSKSRSRS